MTNLKEANPKGIYDVMIIGGGPCGLSAALYAARGGKRTILIEKGMAGGQIAETTVVDNYPGGILEESGIQLSSRMREQAEYFGTEFAVDEILQASLADSVKKLTGRKKVYEGRSVIIATGASPRKIGKPGEQEFTGRGVSYCATCDGFFFSGQRVIVVGGGESALEEGNFLTRFAKEVILVHRKDRFTASAYAQERLKENKKIKVLMNTEIQEIRGDDFIREVILKNLQTGAALSCRAEADGFIGVFIFAGHVPNSDLFRKTVETDAAGFFLADDHMRTNIPGVFAAGDVRQKDLRQVITAAADGAIAGMEAIRFTDQETEKN